MTAGRVVRRVVAYGLLYAAMYRWFTNRLDVTRDDHPPGPFPLMGRPRLR